MTLFQDRIYLIMIAGLAGGLAEIFWIGLYSAVTHTGGLEIARQITAAVVPAWSDLTIAAVLGVIIHLVLSVVLAFLCCTFCIGPAVRYFGGSVIPITAVVVLAGVWAINFLVIVPLLNPAFVTLLPLLVTLLSKLLFGAAMGAVLTRGYADTARRPAA